MLLVYHETIQTFISLVLMLYSTQLVVESYSIDVWYILVANAKKGD